MFSYQTISRKFGMPDVIHVHYPCFYPYSLLNSFQKKGCRVVATEHWSKVQLKQLKNRFQRSLIKFVHHSDSFICVSDKLKKAVIDITNTKRDIKVIPNVLPAAFCVNAKEKIEHEGFNFIAVGRLDPIKHFDFLISVFANTFQSKDNIKLIVVGAGIQENELRRIIEELDCSDRVMLTGHLKPDALLRKYLMSDALIVTSKIETFCLPIAEAMSCGLPVITTTNVGAAEFIDSDRGRIVDYDNAEQLSNAMRHIIQTYSVYNREDIQQYAFSLFHPEVVTKQLLYEYGCRAE